MNNKVDILGIMSLVLGLIGILTICACGLGGVFGTVGLILGIIGIVVHKGKNRAFSILGIVVSSIAIVFAMGWVFLYAIPHKGFTNNKFEEDNLSFCASDYVGANYDDTVSALKKAGFQNIELEKMNDLEPESATKDGVVESITVDGKNDYSSEKVDDNDKKANVIVKYHNIPEFDTKIKIDFSSNILFNKYSVYFYIDGKMEEELKHGEDLEKTYELKKGKHTLKFMSTSDYTVDGEVELLIDCPTEVEYSLDCNADYVEVKQKSLERDIPLEEGQVKIDKNELDLRGKNYKEIEQYFISSGFEKITLVPKYDIVYGITTEGEVDRVYINGFEGFSKGDVFNKNDEVKIVYHMLKEDDPNSVINGEDKEENTDSLEQEANDDQAAKNDEKTYKYEIAYKKEFPNGLPDAYTIYYLFDTDTNEVVTFTKTEGASSKPYVEVGTYSGNFDDGVTVSLPNDNVSTYDTFFKNKQKGNDKRVSVRIGDDPYEAVFEKTDANEAERLIQ